jgi:hypothetical protein
VTHRVIVKRIVNGTVVPDKFYECRHASVSMSREIGHATAVIDFTDGPRDASGWRLIRVMHTNVLSIHQENRDD